METKDNKRTSKGTLYICATPIGNLEDITLRVLRVLQEVDLIACEDTRRTRQLLEHYQIKNARLVSYHEHNEQERTDELIAALEAGQDVALVSDAGTPGIADPGFVVVRKALEVGIRVTSLPGACAAIAALVMSGLTTDRFYFHGFLPRKESKRIRELERMKEQVGTLIFYEAPHRIVACLTDLLQVFGPRPAVLVRELTKLHEEMWTGTLEELLHRTRQQPPKGEIVLLVQGTTTPQPTANHDVLALIQELMKSGVDKKTAVSVTAKITNLPKKEIYNQVVELPPYWTEKD
ncbi:MAG TPA: 16S rRNA (cytidine(1402)-2'-O)-methyltransferase [Firmicutes bacterium]|nr:16S rRNA (cytidine(1402)-2'-O)-methyltransferase [Bacillota bacterium]